MTPESRCQSLPFVVMRLGISDWKASLDCSKMFYPPWNKQQKHLQICPNPKRKGNDQIVFQPSICSGFLRLVSRRVRVYCHPLKEANEQWSCFKIYMFSGIVYSRAFRMPLKGLIGVWWDVPLSSNLTLPETNSQNTSKLMLGRRKLLSLCKSWPMFSCFGQQELRWCIYGPML